MKKIVSLLLSVVLIISFLGITSFASVEPRWTNIGSITYGLVFDNPTNGEASLIVNGKFGATQVIGQIEVYRQSGSTWIHITGDTVTENDRTLTMSVSVPGVSGAYYKAEFTITVYKSGVAETITEIYYATCPKS